MFYLGYTHNRRKQQADLLRCIVYLLSFTVKRLTHFDAAYLLQNANILFPQGCGGKEVFMPYQNYKTYYLIPDGAVNNRSCVLTKQETPVAVNYSDFYKSE